MENQSSRQRRGLKPVVTFSYSESRLGLSGGMGIRKPGDVSIFEYKRKSSHIYFNEGFSDNDVFESWCEYVNELPSCLDEYFNNSPKAFELSDPAYMGLWGKVLAEFNAAIREHAERRSDLEDVHDISVESAKRFLILVPLLALHKPRVYIDATNGCFNVDLATRDNGVLSTQISGAGQIHYSYVAQSRRIFKITGTAKFKDARDFIKFNKILQML